MLVNFVAQKLFAIFIHFLEHRSHKLLGQLACFFAPFALGYTVEMPPSGFETYTLPQCVGRGGGCHYFWLKKLENFRIIPCITGFLLFVVYW